MARRTLLGKVIESLYVVSIWDLEMTFVDPREETDALLKDVIAFEIICADRTAGTVDLGCEGEVVQLVHDKLLHRLDGIIEL